MSVRYPLGGLLLVATLTVFGRTATFDWLHWDDGVLIFSNSTYLPVRAESFSSIWTSSVEGMYNPLTRSLWGLEAWLGASMNPSGAVELNPRVFHAGSLALHAANVLLVFVILRMLVESDWGAFAGALLFAWHPLQVEAVAWISETKGLLCGFFSLLAMQQYLMFTSALRTHAPAGRRRLYYAVALASFLLALLAKSSAVALPLALVAVDLVWMKRSWRETATALGPWFLFSLAGTAVQKLLQPDEALLVSIAPQWRPVVMLDGWSFYLLKLAAPTNLTPFYDHSAASVQQSPLTWVWCAVFVLFVLAAARSRNARVWLLGVGLAAAFTLPYSGLLPHSIQRLSTVNDRYMYLAMLGPAFCLTWFVAQRHESPTIALASLLLIGLGVASFLQTAHWRNDETFFSYAIAQNPRSATAYKGLAYVEEQRGDYRKAEELLRQAIALDPRWSDLQFNLGVALHRQGKRNDAIEAYQEALRLGPHLTDARRNLAIAFLESSRHPEAAAQIKEMLAVDPTSTWAIENLGTALLHSGDYVAAEQHYRRALQRHSTWAAGYANLGVALAEQGKLEPAAQAFRTAVELDPRNEGLRRNLQQIEELQQKK